MKEIQIILSRKSFEELQEMKKKIGTLMEKEKLQTYEEYLEYEKEHPTKCLFG